MEVFYIESQFHCSPLNNMYIICAMKYNTHTGSGIG